MAVKFFFQKEKYGIEGIELKPLTLIYGGTFRQRREILLSIYALFKTLEYVRERRFADDLWEEVTFEYTSLGKQLPFCISIETKVLARALETLYKRFAGQLFKEWIGYIPLLPRLELIPERTDRLFVELNEGESIQISFEGRNRESSSLLYFIDNCGTFSFKEAIAECIIDVFDEVFMKTSSEFYSVHTGAVYFPIERRELSKITKPLNMHDRRKIRTQSIRYFYNLLREHIRKQVKSWNGIIEEFVKKCVFLATMTWMIRGFHFKEYRELVGALLEDRELGFTEGFVPVLKDEKVEILLSGAEEHIKDIAYLLAALGCFSTGRLFIEDVDRHKGYEIQDIMKMLFEELLGFDSAFAPTIKESIQLFATCEGEYLPWHFEDCENELTGIYRLG